MKMKEIRDWVTFATSVVVPLLLWVGASTLRNQRLEMEASMQKAYVSRPEYDAEKTKLEHADDTIFQRMGETNGKLDQLTVQQAQTTQILLDLKEEVKALKP